MIRIDHKAPGRALLADVLQCEIGEIPVDAAIDSFPSWDSLAHMRLVLRLEEMLGRELSSDEMLALESLTELDELLGKLSM